MSDVKRRKGRNKFWLKERIILEFKNVIIPKNPRPKRIFIRKYYNYLERAIDNSNEITWHELYATAKLDFEEICKEPPIWTFDKFVKDLKIYFENGEDLNPTALSVNHNNWYTQLRRAEKNGMFNREDVFAALGLKYQDFIKLKKKYPNKESVREGLIKVYGLNHFHTLTPKVVREEDFPLYLALLEYGSNFEEGCTNIGFKLSKRDEVTPMYLVTLEEKRKYCVIFGYEFEAILNNIFILLKQPFKRNNLIIKGVKPDFTYNEDEIWVDANIIYERDQ